VTVRFRDLPIRRKLLAMTLASSAAAVVLASAGFLVWDAYRFRADVALDVQTQAAIAADAISAAVNFRDERAAAETLRGLESAEHLQLACAYRGAERVLLAAFARAPSRCPPTPPDPAGFSWDRFEHVEPIADGHARVGLLYIRRDLADMHSRLRVAAGTVLGLLLLAIGAAFLVAARMQRSIATPLLDLADTARAVSSTSDFSLRAVPAANDEIGVVVHAFNEMLDRIGDQTSALSTANDELAREVEERRRVEGERTAALERERDANRLKDEFLATLSHELRTPLNAVLGWTRVLRTTQVDDRTRNRALESIERNARVQTRLIEDLLEVSRIVTGKLRLQIEQVDLAAIVDAAVEVVQPAATAKRQHLITRIDARPAMTTGDPNRLQQVVWNLLSNAVKFTPPGGQVLVTLDRRDGYVVTVSDTGPGIEPQFLPHVFEPFRQADATATREHGGLGLGLAIAKRLVELHGGTIAARPGQAGRGTTVDVHLPSVIDAPPPADAAAPLDLPSGGALPPPMLRGVRVLVVDDEEDARLLLQTALASYGADVTAAASAAEGLAAVDRQLPDVILSDIGMPHEDGYAFVRRLRARAAAEGGRIPAVAITAYASGRDRREADEAGFQAHIAKPFEPADVARVIARLHQAHAPLEQHPG
jgi:signal transduction histidine kinase/ActR/RegA family two-component response regulator